MSEPQPAPRTLIDDLDEALQSQKFRDWLRPRGSAQAQVFQTDAHDPEQTFSHWLPYRAWLEDQQMFVNRDAVGFCLELRPQSGTDRGLPRGLGPCLL